MRSDLVKVITECTKAGRGGLYNREVRSKLKNSKGDEDGFFYSSSSKSVRRSVLDWDDHYGHSFGPLKRFFQKQIGKVWDKVYSEIRKHDKKGIILRYLDHYVETKCEKDEYGTVHTRTLTYRWRSSELSHGDIYVDPDDGIIKVYKRNKRQPRNYSRPVTEYKISPDEKLVQENGIWYRYEYGMVERTHPLHRWTDDEGKTHYEYATRQHHEVTSKKQLSSKELRDYGLKNAA